jgi:DNA polymerase I-like protein with 3'-5' exonuclease and polymerase domains
LVETDQDAQDVCEYLLTQDLLALDTETHANGKEGPKALDPKKAFTDPFINTVRLLQVRSRDSESFIFDLRKMGVAGTFAIKNLLSQEHITWVGHNLKFDYKMLATSLDVYLKKVYDTMIAANCVGFAVGDQAALARGYSLKDVVRDYLGHYLDKTEQSSNWSARELTESQFQYAADDLLYLFDLYDLLTYTVRHEYGMEGGVQLEMDVMPVVAKIELNGMALDPVMFEIVQRSAAAYMPALEEELCKYINWPMIACPPLVKLKTKRNFMPKPVSFDGKSGSPLMSNSVMLKAFHEKGLPLENLQGDYLEELAKSSGNEILKKFVFYRDLAKQLSTNYLDWVHPVTGRIHPNLNQMGASTGRFSGSDPNPQNVPTLSVEVPPDLFELYKEFLQEYIDAKTGKCLVNYRYCFVPAKGKKMASADYSGQEVRMMVALSKDPELIRIHLEPAKVERDGKMVKNMAADVHAKTAELMWGKSHGVTCWNADELVMPGVGKKFRAVAKVIVFGLAYGKTAAGMALDWGISQEDAQVIIDEFFRAYPVLKKWLDSKGREANDTRMSWYGCREAGIIRWRMVNSARHADRGALERAGKNTPIQGGSALQMKLALVMLDKALAGTGILMTGTVHDEALFEFYEAEEKLAVTTIDRCMTAAGDVFLQHVIPSTCGVGVGTHWFH